MTAPPTTVSGVVPCPAAVCYALLCDVEAQPAWLPILSYAILQRSRRRKTAPRVAYLLRLVRGSVGLSARIWQRPNELRVRYSNAPSAKRTGSGAASASAELHADSVQQVRFALSAKVVALDDQSCLVQLSVELDLGGKRLPGLERADFAAAPAQVAFEGLRSLLAGASRTMAGTSRATLQLTPLKAK